METSNQKAYSGKMSESSFNRLHELKRLTGYTQQQLIEKALDQYYFKQITLKKGKK